MKLFYCQFFKSNSHFSGKQRRLIYDAELSTEGKYTTALREKVVEAQKGPDKQTDPQKFFDTLISETNKLRDSVAINLKLSPDNNKDAAYLKLLQDAATETQGQINEARDRFVRNNDYARFAAEAKVCIDNAFISFGFWKRNTNLLSIKAVLGHLKHTSDTLYEKRNLLIGTNPTADIASEKEGLLLHLSNCIESINLLGKDLIATTQNKLHDYDELIAGVETDTLPDGQKIRDLQIARNDLSETLSNLGTNIPDELKPFAAELVKKIDEIQRAIEKGQEAYLKDSPELAEKYKTLGSADDAGKIDFRLAVIEHETGPLLEEVGLAQPPSLHHIRALQTYVNLLQQRKEEISKLPNQQEANVQTLSKRADAQLALLQNTLTKTRDAYLKVIGSPVEVTKLLAKGNELKQKIDACKEKLAKVAPGEDMEVLVQLSELQAAQAENNSNLQGTLEEHETVRLTQKLQKDGPVLYSDIDDLQQLNKHYTPDENVNSIINDAQNHFLESHRTLKPLIGLLKKANQAYKDAQRAYEAVKDKKQDDPGRQYAERNLQAARKEYFKQRNIFDNRAKKVDILTLYDQKSRNTEDSSAVRPDGV